MKMGFTTLDRILHVRLTVLMFLVPILRTTAAVNLSADWPKDVQPHEFFVVAEAIIVMMDTMDIQTPVIPSFKKKTKLEKPKIVLLVKLWTESQNHILLWKLGHVGQNIFGKKACSKFFIKAQESWSEHTGPQSPVHLFSVNTMLRHVSQTVSEPAWKCDLGHKSCVPGHELQVWIKHAQTRKWAAAFPLQRLCKTVAVETERTVRWMYRLKKRNQAW